MRHSAIAVALMIQASLAPPAMGANLPVCTAANLQQEHQVIPDGTGGVIVVWEDARSDTLDIYAHHVLGTGAKDPAWPPDGLAVCTAARNQRHPQVAPDGAGGAIVVWEDARDVNPSLYAHHVLATGTVDPAWPAQGLPVTGLLGGPMEPKLVSDGAGGAIIAWVGNGSFSDLYAQHVLASGIVDPGWPAPSLVVCEALGGQQALELLSDGGGGALILWHDYRGGLHSDVYAHHILASGAMDATWPVEGRAVCTATGNQWNPRPVADGAGGAIVVWEDWRNGLPDIFAAHLLASGAVDPGWVANGLGVCTASGYQTSPQLTSDQAGGALVVWEDMRSGTSRVYAHHVQAGGTLDPVPPANGLTVSTVNAWQNLPRVTSDAAGGALVAWMDLRGGEDFDVYAQHLLANGSVDPAWPEAGRVISSAPDDQMFPQLAGSAPGHAIIVWVDERNGGVADLYADGTTAPGIGVRIDPSSTTFELARPRPNPVRGRTTLAFTLAQSEVVRMAVHDAAGRVSRVLVSGTRGPGPHAVEWDLRDTHGRRVPAGLYFARLEVAGQAATRTLIVTR